MPDRLVEQDPPPRRPVEQRARVDLHRVPGYPKMASRPARRRRDGPARSHAELSPDLRRVFRKRFPRFVGARALAGQAQREDHENGQSAGQGFRPWGVVPLGNRCASPRAGHQAEARKGWAGARKGRLESRQAAEGDASPAAMDLVIQPRPTSRVAMNVRCYPRLPGSGVRPRNPGPRSCLHR